MKTLPCVHIAELPVASSADRLMDVSVSHDGRVDALVLDSPPDYRDGLFPKRFAHKPNRYRIVCDLAGSSWEVPVSPLRANIHHARRLPDVHWLLVRARAGGSEDANALVVNADGAVVRAFHIGDAVEDVQVTPGGRIWVGYFDEGVFGGQTAGTAGLGAFGLSGEQAFNFNAGPSRGLAGDTFVHATDFISDCYAFHAASDREVWLCPYTGFPVMRTG